MLRAGPSHLVILKWIFRNISMQAGVFYARETLSSSFIRVSVRWGASETTSVPTEREGNKKWRKISQWLRSRLFLFPARNHCVWFFTPDVTSICYIHYSTSVNSLFMILGQARFFHSPMFALTPHRLTGQPRHKQRT